MNYCDFLAKMHKNDVDLPLDSFGIICRVCLVENVELESIYGVKVENNYKTEQIELVNILKKYCDVEVTPNDNKPQHICKPCIRLFCESYAFFDKCSESNQTLDGILCKYNEELIKNEEDIEICHKATSKKKLKREDGDDDSENDCDTFQDDQYEDSDWEPLSELVKREATKEGIEGMKDDDESSDDEDLPLQTRRKRQIESKQPVRRRGRPRKVKVPKNDTKDSEAIENQHKALMCRLCDEIITDINTAIEHYDENHAPKLEIDVCILCDKPKTYKKRDSLHYHMSLHSKDSIKCIPCRRYFRSKDLLAEHLKECFKADKNAVIKIEEAMEDSDTKPEMPILPLNSNQLSAKVLKETQYDGVFTCQVCKEHLGEIDNVISHFESDHLDDLTCIICMRQFSKQVPLFHLGLHSKKAYVCRPCRIFFKTKEEIDDHNKKYDHDNSLSCKICGKTFTRNYKKNKHMLSHLKEKNYSCNKCGKTFTYKTSLVRHFKMHFGKRFLCSSCGNAYTTKFMLQRHIRIMHTLVDADGNPLPKPPPKPVNLICEFCGEIFTTKYGYGRHIRRHPQFKEFKCKICSFNCDTREQLDVHMEDKHNKYTCDVCNKRFPFESELKTHHRKHEDMRMASFRCELCGKTARTQTQLKVHFRIHTGERPFSCDLCGKAFKQSAHLKVHMFQHTGKMPFSCKICGKSFPFQHVLEIHLRTHTGEKPFQCMFCGLSYHDRTTMQKHQKKKHPDKPIEKTSRSEFKITNL